MRNPKRLQLRQADQQQVHPFVEACELPDMRRAILSRVCKQINHKYMNGINCIYLNYSRDKQQ